MRLAARLIPFATACLLGVAAQSEGLLDGHVFEGMIGPSEAPDLEDRLHFSDGHFWSDICARCGFLPGPYEAEETAAGIEFSGTLRSDSRGEFRYEGVVSNSGDIEVEIRWQRRRWYWTASRDIVFLGQVSERLQAEGLTAIGRRMEAFDPDSNPACARF
jgi:hypothetical protein